MKKKKTIGQIPKSGKFPVILKEYFLPGLMLIFIILLTTFKISGDDDLFWHLKTGQYITENKTIPSSDVFGFATEGQQWIPFEWGFDVLIYNIYSVTGYPGISLFRTLVFLLIFLLIITIIRKLKLNTFISYLVLILLAAGLFERLLIKPQIISYLFSVLLIFILLSYRYIKNYNTKILYFIPALFLLWANMHMGVLSGFILLTIYVVSEFISNKKVNKEVDPKTSNSSLKILLIIYLLSAAALLVNPHGYNTYLYVYSHMQMKMISEVFEWYSPFNSFFSGTVFIYAYYLFLVLSVISLFTLLRQKHWFMFSVLIVFMLFSFRTSRFAVDFMAVSTIIIIYALSLLINRGKPGATEKPVLIYIPAALLVLGIILLPANNLYKMMNYERETGFEIYKNDYPVGAVKFIKEQNIAVNGSRVFNSFGCGGYLVWEIPGTMNFIDSRNLYDEIYYSYKKINNKQHGFETEFEKYNFDFILWFYPNLPHNANEMKTSIISYLFSNNESWKLLYWDDNSFVFVKDQPMYKELIEKYEYKYANPYYYTIDKEPLKLALKNNPEGVTAELQRKMNEESDGIFIKAMAKSFKLN